MLDQLEFSLSLIRHGESEVNVSPDLMGQGGGVSLTAHGMNQASLLRRHFTKQKQTFDLVYSSDYLRALDTAKIVIEKDNDIILAEELREYSAGDWTGLSRKTTLTKDVKLRMGHMNHAFLPPNGESLTQVERRVSRWLEDTLLYNKQLISIARDKREAGEEPLNIAIFSHGMTIKTLLHYVMGFDRGLTWKIIINNTSVSKLFFNEFGWHIASVNDCSHLATR